MAALRWFKDGKKALSGASFIIDVESCRSIAGQSCSGREYRVPPNAYDAIESVKGRLDVVVLMAGSHSQSSTIESELHSLQRLVAARGAQLVVFTLRNLLRGGTVTSSGVTPFERINVMIKRLTRPPKSEFTHIADWKEFSDGHSNWFRHDGIHLNIRGVVALGWYISSVVAHVVQAPCTTYETDICPMPTSANSRGDWLNRFRVKYTEIHCYEDGAMRRKTCERDRRMP